MKTTLSCLTALSLALVATAPKAQDISPEPSYSIAYNIGVISDYRVRGIAQTNFRPALQGGIDFAHKKGYYAGTFASNVDWVRDFNGATRGRTELDLYGGFKDAIDGDWAFDIGLINYRFLNNNSGSSGTPGAGAFSNANTLEAYLNLSFKTFNLKYNRSIGDYLGSLRSSGTQYLDLNASFDLGNGFSLTPHVGHLSIPDQGAPGNLGDYTDYSLSLAKDFGNGLAVTAAAITTNTHRGAGTFYRDLGGRDLGRGVVSLAAKYSF